MKPEPDKLILKKIKDYDPRLFVEWDDSKNLWMMKRNASDGSVQHCFYIQNEDGSFRPLDNRVMKELYECDIWKHFKNGSEYHKFLADHNAAVSLKHETIRQDYIRWWNKEHKTEWKEAIDNAQRKVLEIPKESERKIIIT